MMRASKYVLIGSPELQTSRVEFCGIGNYRAATLGQFETRIVIDGNLYAIVINVVPDAVLQYDLLIGTDFLDFVEFNVKRGVISIKPLCELTTDDGEQPEILAIDAIQYADEVDVAYIRNADHRRAVTDLITD